MLPQWDKFDNFYSVLIILVIVHGQNKAFNVYIKLSNISDNQRFHINYRIVHSIFNQYIIM